MSNATIIFLLTLCIMILICIIVYQQFVFHNGTKAKIHEISSKLKELLDTDSDENQSNVVRSAESKSGVSAD